MSEAASLGGLFRLMQPSSSAAEFRAGTLSIWDSTDLRREGLFPGVNVSSASSAPLVVPLTEKLNGVTMSDHVRSLRHGRQSGPADEAPRSRSFRPRGSSGLSLPALYGHRRRRITALSRGHIAGHSLWL